MNYDRNSRCKICNSDLVDKIDRYLEKGKSYQSICDWVNKKDLDIKLDKKNVWTHNTKHRNQDNETTKPGPRGRKKGLKNEIIKTKIIKKKVIKKKVVEKKTVDDNIKENNDDFGMEKTTAFLDSIIEKVKIRLEKGEIKPTITEGIKATELKIKIDKGSPFEDTLLNFLEGVSSKDANKS